MAVFPKSESNVTTLAQEMINGLTQYGELFPSVTPDALTALEGAYNLYQIARNDQASAQAAAKNATIAKDQRQDALEEQMHKIIYLAEHDNIETPGNLDYIGWGSRKPPSALTPPGQPIEFTPVEEGAGYVTFQWKKPVSGGAVSSYIIERSDQPAGGGIPGPWTLITTVFGTNARLDNQPRGIEMQYRVTAINAAGASAPSAGIVSVVL